MNIQGMIEKSWHKVLGEGVSFSDLAKEVAAQVESHRETRRKQLKDALALKDSLTMRAPVANTDIESLIRHAQKNLNKTFDYNWALAKVTASEGLQKCAQITHSSQLRGIPQVLEHSLYQHWLQNSMQDRAEVDQLVREQIQYYFQHFVDLPPGLSMAKEQRIYDEVFDRIAQHIGYIRPTLEEFLSDSQ